MTNKEKAERIADAILAPLPEGIEVELNSCAYLIPKAWRLNAGGDYLFSAETPVSSCAGGRAVLGLTDTKEKAVEVINSRLGGIGTVSWAEHAAKYFEVKPEVMREIGYKFFQWQSLEKVVEELKSNPEQFFQTQDTEE